MYNGIGLDTPRGSGTNGYVQRNLSSVRKTKEKIVEYKDTEDRAVRPFDVELIEHERKRQTEVRCLELRELLEENGISEDKIEEKIAAFRKKLLEEKKSNIPRDASGRPILKDSHELSMAQEHKNEKAKLAFGIREDFIPGSSMKGKLPPPADAESVTPALEEAKPDDKASDIMTKSDKERRSKKKRRSSSSSSSSSSLSSSDDEKSRKKRRRKEKKKKSKKSSHHKDKHRGHKKEEEAPGKSRSRSRDRVQSPEKCGIEVQPSPPPSPTTEIETEKPGTPSEQQQQSPLSHSSRHSPLASTANVVDYSSDSESNQSNNHSLSSHASSSPTSHHNHTCIQIIKIDDNHKAKISTPVEIVTVSVPCNSHYIERGSSRSRSRSPSPSTSSDVCTHNHCESHTSGSGSSSSHSDSDHESAHSIGNISNRSHRRSADYHNGRSRSLTRSSSRSYSRSLSSGSDSYHERDCPSRRRRYSYNSHSESHSPSPLRYRKKRARSYSSTSRHSSPSPKRQHKSRQTGRSKSRSRARRKTKTQSKSEETEPPKRKRSTLIPRRRQGSPSYLERRRITSARKRPIIYKRRHGSEWEVSSDSSGSSYSD